MTAQANGTRWGRTALIAVPALVLAGVVGANIAGGALAASFVAQSTTASLTAESISGQGAGLVALPNRIKDKNGNIGEQPVARFGIAHARVGGLCFAQHATVLGQDVTLFVTSTDDDPSTSEIELNGVILDATNAAGSIQTIGDAAVNKNGKDIQVGTSAIDLGGTADQFGLQAPGLELKNIKAKVLDLTIPNTFTSPAVTAHIKRGNVDCPTPGAKPGR